jgi:hypothetical protein
MRVIFRLENLKGRDNSEDLGVDGCNKRGLRESGKEFVD